MDVTKAFTIIRFGGIRRPMPYENIEPRESVISHIAACTVSSAEQAASKFDRHMVHIDLPMNIKLTVRQREAGIPGSGIYLRFGCTRDPGIPGPECTRVLGIQ